MVIEVVEGIKRADAKKLKSVQKIVDKMLYGEDADAKLNSKVRKQVRKRKLNQAIRILHGMKYE